MKDLQTEEGLDTGIESTEEYFMDDEAFAQMTATESSVGTGGIEPTEEHFMDDADFEALGGVTNNIMGRTLTFTNRGDTTRIGDNHSLPDRTYAKEGKFLELKQVLLQLMYCKHQIQEVCGSDGVPPTNYIYRLIARC